VHSLVHYFNFAVSLAAYQVHCKWDGDEIAAPAALGRVVAELRALEPGSLRWWLSPWRLWYLWYTGVNLWDHQGETLVTKRQSLMGNARDHFFRPAGRLIRYRRIPKTAYVFKRVLVPTYIGCLFYHLKGLKRDRGYGNFYFDENPDSLYLYRLQRYWKREQLMTYEECGAVIPDVRGLPHPATLGIRPPVRAE
jgi:hypothetical protein